MKQSYPRPNKSAFDKSIDFLARRNHSELELREKLGLRQYTTEEIDTAIHKLWDRKYLLAPEELAKKFARMLDQRGRGIQYIQQYLKKKGLPEIDRELSEETDKAKDLIARRLQFAPPYDYIEETKIKRYLANRGYNFECILKVINNEES